MPNIEAFNLLAKNAPEQFFRFAMDGDKQKVGVSEAVDSWETRELGSIKGVLDAYAYLIPLIQNKTRLTSKHLCEIHRICSQGIAGTSCNSGLFRNCGAGFKLTPKVTTEAGLRELIIADKEHGYDYLRKELPSHDGLNEDEYYNELHSRLIASSLNFGTFNGGLSVDDHIVYNDLFARQSPVIFLRLNDDEDIDLYNRDQSFRLISARPQNKLMTFGLIYYRDNLYLQTFSNGWDTTRLDVSLGGCKEIADYLKTLGPNNYRNANAQGVELLERLMDDKLMDDTKKKLFDNLSKQYQLNIATEVEKTLDTFYQKLTDIAGDSDEKMLAIATLVQRLERIHPFADCNCRTFCMILLNTLLMQEDMSPAILDDPNKADGYSLSEFAELIKQGMEETQRLCNFVSEIDEAQIAQLVRDNPWMDVPLDSPDSQQRARLTTMASSLVEKIKFYQYKSCISKLKNDLDETPDLRSEHGWNK